jgi:hypothetical protein
MIANLDLKHNDLERLGEEKGYAITVDAEKELDLSGLKLASDGKTVLIPQPSDDPNDPLNWSYGRKIAILLTVSATAFLPGEIRHLFIPYSFLMTQPTEQITEVLLAQSPSSSKQRSGGLLPTISTILKRGMCSC